MAAYIEFFGLPGTGKTTLCNELRNQLEKEGFISIKYSEIKQCSLINCLKNGVYLKLLFYIAVFSWQNNKRVIAKRTIAVWINALKVLSIYKYKINSKKSVIILDQSFLQDFLSIMHSDKIINLKFYEKAALYYYSFIHDPLVVCTNLDMEQTISRISNRPTRQSRADNMKESELLRLLCIQNENFRMLCPTIKSMSIIVDTALPERQNVNHILDSVKRI